MSASGRAASLAADDAAVVAGQLDRIPRNVTGVAVRCRFGLPAVIESAPVLSGGSPNPTLLYLTCPALTAYVSGIEAGGGVKAFRERCREDQALSRAIGEVTTIYRNRRAHLAGVGGVGARLDAGIGGPVGPERASCLHAYAAAFLAVGSGWLAQRNESGDRALRARDLMGRVARIWADIFSGVDEPWCSDRRCARWTGCTRRAVIDVGTISVRLLVADATDLRTDDVVRRAEVTRLGQGLGARGRLSPEAMGRTAEVVSRYVEEARTLGAGCVTLVGTSAAREAADGRAFIDGLGRQHRIGARVLSGEDEARLAYAGASTDIRSDLVVLDVGGGSTELIARKEDGVLDWVSLDLGASRATERWLTGDPPTEAQLKSAYREACTRLHGLRSRFGSVGAEREGEGRILVGVAGTVTTLACLDAGLEVYDRDVVHLRELRAETVTGLLADLVSMTALERAGLPCVQEGRAAVIIGGAVVLLAVMESLGFGRLKVSERDLLDGLIMLGAC